MVKAGRISASSIAPVDSLLHSRLKSGSVSGYFNSNEE